MPLPGPENLESLIAPVCDGDEVAWQALWRKLDPELDALVRRRRMLGRLSEREDDRRGVVLLVMAKLRQDGFRRLKMYSEERRRNADLSLLTWLTVVLRNCAVDYARAHPDYVPGQRQGSARPGGIAEGLPLPPASRGPGARPPVTAARTAGELLEFVRRELPEEQQRALELWMAGHDAADIAAALGLASAAAATRIVRAAVERLRRQFRTALTGVGP